ncbi:TonB family protein [Microcoleus sp. MON2_D6]|uniref:TonB family protein n=1 Tax=unclassified Microcoleus TaxID=2642155 RepID=UPI002FD48100
MSFSNISATQRQQQEEALKKVLAISLLASTLLHGVALPLSLKFVKPAEFEEDAIEIVVLDEPKVEETQPEQTIPEKASPPPETLKPEPPPDPTPAEEPPVAATPPPIPEEPPVAATPPPIPEEPPVAVTPPPIPEEPPVAATPPPIPEEPPVAVTPPPIPEEPSPAPQEDFNSPKTPQTPIAQEPETPSPDPPKSEPPVSDSRPKGAASLPDFTKDAGNLNSSDSPENQPPASAGSGEPSSEPLNPSSGPLQRSPAAGPPVTATRPGGGSNSGNAIGDLTNPSSPDSPGGSASNSPSGARENGNIPSDEPFAAGSGRSPRSPAAGSPVTATRPGGGGNSGSAIGDVGNLPSSGSPAGSASNSSPGGGGNGGGGSSQPFGNGSGPMPKPTNPGRGGSPSRPPGAPLATCISGCGKPDYPIAAREEGRQGQVELICDIDPNGKTSNIKILTPSKYNDLNRAAMKQVQERKYAPSESGIQGERIVIIFRLTD